MSVFVERRRKAEDSLSGHLAKEARLLGRKGRPTESVITAEPTFV